MSVSAVSNSYPILHNAFKQADEAAAEINSVTASSSNALEFNKVDTKPVEKSDDDLTSSLVKLNQAELYGKTGTTVRQREREMIGSLLDVHI